MSLANEFNEWYRKSVFTTSKGGNTRFNKLVKRLESLESRPTVRPQRAAQAKGKITLPAC